MKTSAGILLYKVSEGELLFFLVHPGGPYFRNKQDGWWTIPKGEPNDDESAMETALREFEEETGYRPHGSPIELTSIIQKGGKQVQCWAIEGDIDPEHIQSNTFELEWPPKSGKKTAFAEIDKAGWFNFKDANLKINERQRSILKELLERIDSR